MKTTNKSSASDPASTSETSPDEARFKRANRRQVEMITLSLNQRLDVDHPVRAVWAFVEGLNLSELYAKIKAVKGKLGAGAIDPRILFALWIYATIRGIGSGRRIDELCHPQHGETAYQWICGGVPVNYHTINDFRTAHPECLDRCLTESVAVLMNEGLVSLDRIAQDGMRVRADASGKSFHREPTLETCLAEAEEQVRLLRDESNNDSSGSTRREKAAKERHARERKERHARERKERIQSALGQIQDVRDKAEKRKKGDGEKARCSTTDPDGAHENGGRRLSSGVQCAVRGLEKVKCEVMWQVLAGVFQRGLNLRKLAAEGVIRG